MLGVVAQTFTPSTEEAGGSLSLRASWFSEFQANQGSIVKISVSKEKQIHSPPQKKSLTGKNMVPSCSPSSVNSYPLGSLTKLGH